MREQQPTAMAAIGGFQFLHLESYARRAGSGKAAGHDLASIVAEAERAPDACPHVSAPKPPVIHHGCTPAEAAQRAAEWAESARDSLGRKLRIDGLCLAAGVVSFPKERVSEWPAYRSAAIDWMRGKYGERLLSVIEHTDEEHPHLHFYCVPLPGERFEEVHPGRKASAEAKARKEKKGAQNSAYQAAMREWQDDFHEKVASAHGLTRLGPRRRRLTREEWRLEQSAHRALASSQFRTGDFVSATPLPAQPVDQDVIRAEAFNRIVNPTRSILGKTKYTKEMVEEMIDHAVSETEMRARDDERRRLDPIIQQAGFAAGATAAIKSMQIELADTRVLLDETERARDDWQMAAVRHERHLDAIYKVLSADEIAALTRRMEIVIESQLELATRRAATQASDADSSNAVMP
jgi:hypothetical protein